MELHPYSIYWKNRPIRIAFFINIAEEQKLIDWIFEYCRSRWGGRYYPIVPTDGISVDTQWWELLKSYDPDLLVFYHQPQPILLQEIQTELSSYNIEIISPDNPHTSFAFDPISISPTKRNYELLDGNLYSDERTLVLFNLDRETPDDIKKFVSRNFGGFYTDNMIPQNDVQRYGSFHSTIYKINDYESLNSALSDIGDAPYKKYFPSQICSFPDYLDDVEYQPENQKLMLIVGDSQDELVYFWNRQLALPKHFRKRITQLWLPAGFCDIKSVMAGIIKFAQSFGSIIEQNNSFFIHFVSFSLNSGILEKKLGYLKSPLHNITINTLTTYIYPRFREYRIFLSTNKEMQFFKARSTEEHLSVIEPDIERASMHGGEAWAIDIYIQYRPEQFTNIHGKDYWWKLPRRNEIVSNSRIFDKPARINKTGTFSVFLKRNVSFDSPESFIRIKAPSDMSIFYSLICGTRNSILLMNKHVNITETAFEHIQLSDKGRYFSGILSLFPDLFNMSVILEELYWRRIFEKMSGQNAGKDEGHKISIQNVLKKNIGQIQREIGLHNFEWLSNKIFSLSKSFARREIDLKYEIFEVEAKKITEEYNRVHSSNLIPFEEHELKEIVSELIDWNVLLIGIKPKCPSCGYRFWYHINETSQKISCSGCGCTFSLAAQETWYYRLNSLVRAAFSEHGVIPNILVLHQLMSSARDSFIYVPNINLYTKSAQENENRLHSEIDISCIVDGEFIIGEVKQSIKLFNRNDFEKMFDIAIIVQPGKIIFSSMDENSSAYVNEQITELEQRLSALKIKVEWFQLHSWIFEPHPVR